MVQLRVIDLSSFYSEGAAGRRRVAAEIDAACREIGFFAVVGHGVDADLVEGTRKAVRAFFALPEAAKLATRPATANGRGYVPLEGEVLSSTTAFRTAPDMKESFSIGPFDVGDGPYFRYEPSGIAFAPNIWPSHPPQLSLLLRRYYRALAMLADDLMTLTSLAFGLPENWFAAKFDRPTSALRVLHYPPRVSLEGDQFPASAHTDYGTWTILKKRPGETGLQAQSVRGDWIDVIAPEGAFVVNVGDLLMRWTGGHWLSTLHRVVPVEQVEEGGEVSLVFFQQPNWDVVIYPFTKSDVHRYELEARYKPDSTERHYLGVMVGEFVFGKYRTSVSAGAFGVEDTQGCRM